MSDINNLRINFSIMSSINHLLACEELFRTLRILNVLFLKDQIRIFIVGENVF